MKSFPLDDQQHATVIAALRYYQRAGQGEPSNRDDWTHDLATNGEAVVSLDADAIDDLIEHLQFDGEDKLATFKADFDAKLAAMTDEELVASFAALGVTVKIRRPPPPMTGIQKQCWDGMTAKHPGIEELDEAFIKAVDDAVDSDDPEVCDSCGAPTDDGEGYDGLCGNCADVAELHQGRDDLTEEANEAACREDRDACETCGDKLGDDSYEGLCSDCAEREVEKMSSRGMAANPKPPTEDA